METAAYSLLRIDVSRTLCIDVSITLIWLVFVDVGASFWEKEIIKIEILGQKNKKKLLFFGYTMKPMQIMITIHKTKPPTMIAMKKGCEIKSESDYVKEFVIHIYFFAKKFKCQKYFDRNRRCFCSCFDWNRRFYN